MVADDAVEGEPDPPRLLAVGVLGEDAVDLVLRRGDVAGVDRERRHLEPVGGDPVADLAPALVDPRPRDPVEEHPAVGGGERGQEQCPTAGAALGVGVAQGRQHLAGGPGGRVTRDETEPLVLALDVDACGEDRAHPVQALPQIARRGPVLAPEEQRIQQFLTARGAVGPAEQVRQQLELLAPAQDDDLPVDAELRGPELLEDHTGERRRARSRRRR